MSAADGLRVGWLPDAKRIQLSSGRVSGPPVASMLPSLHRLSLWARGVSAGQPLERQPGSPDDVRLRDASFDVVQIGAAALCPRTAPPVSSETAADASRIAAIGAPYAFLQPDLRVGFSLVDELNARIHWRNVQRRLLALTGDAPTDALERRLRLVERAVHEYEVYRKWLIACAAPPLAFSGRVDRDEAIAAMIKWVARGVDSVVAGEPLAPPGAFEQARNEARVREAYEAQLKQAQRWRAELAKEEAALKRLDAAFVASAASAATGPMPPGRNERLFWLPLLRCDPFGADAPKNGYNRRYQAWLGEALLQPDDDAGGTTTMDADEATVPPAGKKRAVAPAVSSASAAPPRYAPPAAYGLGGSAYNGDLPPRRDPSKWTTEHVVPREWCKLTMLFDEASAVLHNVHLLSLATAAENASRGFKPLSFVTYESLRTFRRRRGSARAATSADGAGGDGGDGGDGERFADGTRPSDATYDAATMAAYLYDPRGFSEVRKAAAARVTACAFLTYPLLSDAPSYAGWPTGQLGSALYGAQWAHLRRLLLDAPPTEWEQRLDWMQWYRYGWNNPLIHDAGAFTGASMQHRLLVGVEALLRDRLRGTDAMGQLLYEAVAGGRDVEGEIARVEAAIRRIERERGRGVERRPASSGAAGGGDDDRAPPPMARDGGGSAMVDAGGAR